MSEIYIIFGDTPRTDGDNIESIYFSKKKAVEKKKYLEEEWGQYTSFHIECHDVIE